MKQTNRPAKDQTIYLQHMVETAREVEGFARGVTRQEFDESRALQIILAHLLQIIGEAARLVSEPVRARIPLPWKVIVGMRHQIVHEYFRVNRNIVWQTATEDIAPLIAAVEPVLSAMREEMRREASGVLDANGEEGRT